MEGNENFSFGILAGHLNSDIISHDQHLYDANILLK